MEDGTNGAGGGRGQSVRTCKGSLRADLSHLPSAHGSRMAREVAAFTVVIGRHAPIGRAAIPCVRKIHARPARSGGRRTVQRTAASTMMSGSVLNGEEKYSTP